MSTARSAAEPVALTPEPLETLLESTVVAAGSAPGRRERAAALRDALGAVALRPEWVNVASVVRTVVDKARVEASPGTRVAYSEPSKATYVFADATYLRLAILHLLSNALRAASDQPAGEVNLSITRSAAGGVYLEIADNGTGMDEEALELAFVPFFTTRAGKASGMGLPLARAMLEASGGSLRLESAPGVGTIAYVELPPPPIGERE